MQTVSRFQKFENPTAIGTTTYPAAATAPTGAPQRSFAIPYRSGGIAALISTAGRCTTKSGWPKIQMKNAGIQYWAKGWWHIACAVELGPECLVPPPERIDGLPPDDLLGRHRVARAAGAGMTAARNPEHAPRGGEREPQRTRLRGPLAPRGRSGAYSPSCGRGGYTGRERPTTSSSPIMSPRPRRGGPRRRR